MEDLINIFIKPSAVFEHQRNKSFAIPASIQTVLLIVLLLALGNLLSPFFDAEVARGMAEAAKKGQVMPPEARATAEKFGRVIAMVIVAITPWLTALFGGIFGYIAARILGMKIGFGQSMLIASWAGFTAVLGTLAMAIRGMMMDPASIRGVTDGMLGVGTFIDPTTASPIMLAVAQSVDLFGIWGIFIAAAGFSVIGRVPFSKGLTAAIIKWGIALVIAVAMASLRG